MAPWSFYSFLGFSKYVARHTLLGPAAQQVRGRVKSDSFLELAGLILLAALYWHPDIRTLGKAGTATCRRAEAETYALWVGARAGHRATT